MPLSWDHLKANTTRMFRIYHVPLLKVLFVFVKTMRSNSETDRNNSTQYKVNGFYFTENFLKSPTNFSNTHVRICVKDATPLLEPGKMYGGGGVGGRGVCAHQHTNVCKI